MAVFDNVFCSRRNRRTHAPLNRLTWMHAMAKPATPSKPTLNDSLPTQPRMGTEEGIAVAEEVATISKQARATGKVRVRTVTDAVEEMARATLQEDAVEVTRVPVDKIVDTVPEVRTEGDVTILPVLEEVLVVEKRLVLKEELHIRRRTTAEQVEVPVTLRRQRAVVERIDPEGKVTEE